MGLGTDTLRQSLFQDFDNGTEMKLSIIHSIIAGIHGVFGPDDENGIFQS
jgi:hypothetical protein